MYLSLLSMFTIEVDCFCFCEQQLEEKICVTQVAILKCFSECVLTSFKASSNLYNLKYIHVVCVIVIII